MSVDHTFSPEHFSVAGGTLTRSVGDRLQWSGRQFEVIDVAPLVPGYEQVVLAPLDREGLPVSMPASDLFNAVSA